MRVSCLFALFAPAAFLLQVRCAFAAETLWTGSAQCQLTVQSTNYMHTETQTWVINGPPQLQGSLSVFPATWNVTAQGKREDNQGGQTSTTQWSANVVPMDAPLVIWVRPTDNQLIVKSYHSQLRSNAGVLSRQSTIAQIKQAPQSYVEYEWPFPAVQDVSTSASISGSSSSDVAGGIGPMQPAGLPGKAVCQWHFAKGATALLSTKTIQGTTLSQLLPPVVQAWVDQEAKAVSQSPAPSISNIQSDAQAFISSTSVQIPPGVDIEEIAFIVLMEAANDLEKDLKDMMGEVKQVSDTKQQLEKLMIQINLDASNVKGKTLVCTTPACQSLAATLAQMATATPLISPSANLAAQGNLTPVRLQQILALTKTAQANLDSLLQQEQANAQGAQQRQAKMQALSTLLQKTSNTNSGIVSNIK